MICGLLAAGLADAQLTRQRPEIAAIADCGSVVIVRCDRPADAAVASRTHQRARSVELRRQDPQQLDGVVIEAEALRRRTIEEVIGAAFPPVSARDGTRTFATGDGSQCTCMNVCPPFPFPCCNCSSLMNRYMSTPGSSPLN